MCYHGAAGMRETRQLAHFSEHRGDALPIHQGQFAADVAGVVRFSHRLNHVGDLIARGFHRGFRRAFFLCSHGGGRGLSLEHFETAVRMGVVLLKRELLRVPRSCLSSGKPRNKTEAIHGDSLADLGIAREALA